MMSNVSIESLLEGIGALCDREPGSLPEREQALGLLAPCVVEGAYELVDAVRHGDIPGLREEIGGLYFLALLITQLAEELGYFSRDEVMAEVAYRFMQDHPNVSRSVSDKGRRTGAGTMVAAWEAYQSRKPRCRGHAADGGHGGLNVAHALPALVRAVKLQDQAARVGFDWPEASPVLDKIREELAELHHEIHVGGEAARLDHELGDVLLAVSNLARHLDVDPEAALHRANRRFERRYARMEALIAEQGGRLESASLEQMELLWQEAKRDEG